ncbi:PASTA domain-containing protein [Peptococcus simiae]|uniref:PASTA domain-containing protein n=1 Tax=Peptococcus simiae TaxID=1643805 RepID=UPI00397E9685
MISKVVRELGKQGLKLAVGHLPEVKQVANEAQHQVKTRLAQTVKVPDLVRKGFPLTIDQAETLVSHVGLEILPVPLKVSEADPAYAGHSPDQVLAVNPKPGKRVAKGSIIVVRYIPEEVLVASQRLSQERDREKADKKEARDRRISQRKDRATDFMVDTKNKADRVRGKAKEGLGQVFGKKQEDQEE